MRRRNWAGHLRGREPTRRPRAVLTEQEERMLATAPAKATHSGTRRGLGKRPTAISIMLDCPFNSLLSGEGRGEGGYSPSGWKRLFMLSVGLPCGFCRCAHSG